MSLLFQRLVAVCLLFTIVACSSSESASTENNVVAEQAQEPTEQLTEEPTEEPTATPSNNVGRLVTREPQNTPTRAAQAPTIVSYDPKLVIGEIVDFNHDSTGIKGLKPESWTLFDGGDSFQISSAPKDPNGFITLYEESEPSGFVAIRDEIFTALKLNYPSMPNANAKVIKENVEPDGSGMLEAIVFMPAQGDDSVIYEMHMYARAIPTNEAIIVTFIMIPEANYLEHAALFRGMVDSIRLEQ